MAVVSLYFVYRYAGRWAEADSTTFATVIRPFVEEGRLLPVGGAVYPNGYAYQAISTYILALTGLDVATLQQLIYPFVAVMVVLPAWVLYRELIGSPRGATLTTLLLFTQPEFLFVILRSSHEKFTRTLMLLCLFFLVRSLRLRDRPWALAVHVGLFYLAAFGFIASNNLLAHSFIFAIASALALGWLLAKRSASLQWQSRGALHRFTYATLICLGLVYVFTFYIYPPAQHDLIILKSIGDRIAALFLDVQSQTTNAYAQVEAGWIAPAPYVYFMVSIANWIILVTSFVIWLRQGFNWLWRGKPPKTQPAWLLWLFYAAFAIQGALSVVADASGALASNLQHRLFPSFSIIAVALVGAALAQWRPRRFARAVRLGLTVSIACVAILSVFKATNEPLLSNKWTFYRSAELDAIVWSDSHLRDAEIWTEFDERLIVAFFTEKGGSPYGNHLQGGLRPDGRDIVLTTLTRLRSSRLGLPLPVPPDAFRVYDNGEAELYHLRPQTQFQR